MIEGEHAMQLFRRAGDGWTLVGAADVEMLAATFDAGETRLATVDNTPDRHGVVELDTTTGTIVRRWTAPIIFELAYAGTALYEVSADPMQIERLGDGGARVRDVDLRLTHGMSLARVGTFVAALESPRRILVGLPGTRAVIHPPLDVLGIAGDPGGRYLFGMCGSKLLVWDLTYMVPALADTPAADEVGFVDPDTLVVSELRKDMDRDLAVYHLASGSFALARRELLGRIETLDGILTGPGGMLAVLDRRRGDIHVLRPQLHLPHLSAPIFTLAVAGGWVAAILRDGNVYRRSPHGAQVQVPEESVGSPTIDAAGVMSFASERDLYRWPTDAPPAVLAHFDVDIAFVHLTVGGRLAVVTVDGTLYVVDPGTREVRTVFRSSSSARGSVPFTFSDDGAIAATQLDDGIGIVDLRSGERWTIATGTPYHALAMSPDGRFVVAVEQPLDRHGNLLYRFPIDVPTPSPGSLAELTNARAPARPRGELDWRDSAP